MASLRKRSTPRSGVACFHTPFFPPVYSDPSTFLFLYPAAPISIFPLSKAMVPNPIVSVGMTELMVERTVMELDSEGTLELGKGGKPFGGRVT
jgi:hypothetical protein